MPAHPYGPDKPPLPHSTEELRARIPGWGADVDPADRPSVPRERFDPGATGAHWEVPEPQPETRPRERSIEHAALTPVFGTACPPRGVSGAIRRLSYRRFSEGRAAHWLLLLAADRVEVAGSVAGSWARGRPENPLLETGLRTEVSHDGLAARRGRPDARHQMLDPVVVAGPWLLAGYGAFRAGRAAIRALGR